MANLTSWTPSKAQGGLSAAQLAGLSELTVRQLRELIRLGAIPYGAHGTRTAYSDFHLEHALRAKRLLAVGLSCREVAAVVLELNTGTRAASALLVPALTVADNKPVRWAAGRVKVIAPALRSADEQRLLCAISESVKGFQRRSKEVRAAIRTR